MTEQQERNLVLNVALLAVLALVLFDIAHKLMSLEQAPPPARATCWSDPCLA